MRFVTFELEGRTAPGILEGEEVVELGGALDFGALLQTSGPWERLATHRLADVRLRAPIPRPPKIVAVGLNYTAHAREQGKEPPAAPMFFAKARNCVIGPDEAIVLPPGRERIDVEVELAVVIGRPCFQATAEEAMECVLGFTVFNDVSDREAQKSDGQFYRAKSWATFGPMGPWIATPDAVPWADAAIRLRRNGEVQQDSRTSDMTHAVPRLLALLSQVHELEPGDVIATGTPAGVGVHRRPPVFLQDGDLIECSIEGLGALRNPVRRGSPVSAERGAP